MIDSHRLHFLLRKGNVLMPSHFNDAALAGDGLVEASTIFKFDRNNVVADTRFFVVLQVIDTFDGKLNQALHFAHLLRVE